LANTNVNPNEILFLGVASSAPDGFPLVVGLGFPDSGLKKTVFIKPPEDWGLLKEEGNVDNKEARKGKNQNKIIEGIKVVDLIKKGIGPKQASEQILEVMNERCVYSVNPRQDSFFLGKMGNIALGKLQLYSAMAFFDEIVLPERERELQLKTKTNIRFYPRNKSDIGWLMELYFKCRQSRRG
jgi:hypothetical protein